jgi:hypothetical protein
LVIGKAMAGGMLPPPQQQDSQHYTADQDNHDHDYNYDEPSVARRAGGSLLSRYATRYWCSC